MVQLSNGAKIEYDWSALSQKEFRLLLENETDKEAKDIIVGKLVGMTADELTDLNPLDYYKVTFGVGVSYRKETSFDESKN